MATSLRPWILIPARGGSKEIPRKALRLLGGKPLVRHAVESMASAFGSDRVVVSTDDPEIAHVCTPFALVHVRPPELGGDDVTLDAVAVDAARMLLARGEDPSAPLVTVQPTSPFVSAASVSRAIEALGQGAKSVVSVRDDRHLRWSRDDTMVATPLFDARVNRQWLPSALAETGGVIGARLGDIAANGTRIIAPTSLLELEGAEAIDIDTVRDWMVAESVLAGRHIVIRADAGTAMGMGHAYRAIALATELLGHRVTIVTSKGPGAELGASFFASRAFPTRCVEGEKEFLALLSELRPDVTILDVLDTTRDFVRAVRTESGFVVNIEDLGEGSAEADLVINDLYSSRAPRPNQWFGLEVALLAPQFETIEPREGVAAQAEKVLVTFGGTDPNNLTGRALEALRVAQFMGDVTVVLGPGREDTPLDLASYGLRGRVLRDVTHMALLMREQDVALTSAGRTVTELMTMGVPTIVLCQNERELTHTHASAQLGVINLGLGVHTSPEGIAAQVRMLMENQPLRAEMRRQALAAVSGRSNRAIVSRILAAADAARAR
jgi:spore coat polysaccharide biosynthesis predicted glycosyltransferase SpsG/CMP-N-acetylneuraminic acid synthetase